MRTCAIRDEHVTVGAHNAYSRLILRDPVTVPFELSGEIRLHDRLDDVWIYGENRAPTWVWGVNLHPVFVDEDNNVVTGFAPNGKNRWSASGQIDHRYGIPRSEVFVAGIDHDTQFGAWHTFRMVVPTVGTHEVYWDDTLAYRVVEKSPPAAWWDRELRAGLRLDFYDVELRNMNVVI